MTLYRIARPRLRRSLSIAVAVWILTLLNHGDVILGRNATAAMIVKTGLNDLVPFFFSNLGLLGGRTAASTGGAA